MLHDAPLWARTVLIWGIVAFLLGLGLTVWDSVRRNRTGRQD